MVYTENGSVSIEAIFQSGNLYNYCVNNPVKYVDESGEWIQILIGAVVGGIANGVISAFDQYYTTGEVDLGRTLIAVGTGAVSGGLAATGVGLLGQIAGNAVLGGVGSFADQLYVNKGDINKVKFVDMMTSAFIGGLGGSFGGAGGGSKSLDKLTQQLFKRIGNALKYESGAMLKKEFTNALSYYYKCASKQNIAIVHSILESCFPAFGKTYAGIFTLKVE